MSKKELVEKIIHLEDQIYQIDIFKYGILNTLKIAAYYTNCINKYITAL
jgi:hypothetical protein